MYENLRPFFARLYVPSTCYLSKSELLFVNQSLMSRFNVQGFPTILVFGADKENPVLYEGARTAAAIESFALEQLEANVGPAEVIELTDPVYFSFLGCLTISLRFCFYHSSLLTPLVAISYRLSITVTILRC
jgi:hypothetical protein